MKKIIYLSIIVLLLLIILKCYIALHPTPEEALQDFYRDPIESGRAEDMLIDPLIICGNDVVPLIMKEIVNPDMPSRNYAIFFLGNGEYVEAQPLLEEIVAKPNESSGIKQLALQSIWRINPERGKQLALLYQNEENSLGYTARLIINHPEQLPSKRTYWDALTGKHE